MNYFSKNTIDNINNYVYRLIDPRNGNTFYVGRGKGNRVFEHVNGQIKNLDEDEKSEINDEDPFKIKTIKSIINEGLKVLHIIHRWNLTLEEAKIVEAALIDAYPGLTNMVRGYHSDYGVIDAISLNRKFDVDEYEEPENLEYMIVKVKDWVVMDINNGDRYEATRKSWKVNIQRANNIKYVLSVTNGIVKEVYEVDYWEKTNDDRSEFVGRIAKNNIRNLFYYKRIPNKYCVKGLASPILYSKK